MKIVGLIASLFFTFISIGQKSYYFSEPLPGKEKKVTNVDSKLFGTYNAKGIARGYVFKSDGIIITSTSISSISRETIRESTTYDVRNNYIFGVIENDSIPCVLEGERYYFGIQNRDVLVGESSQNVLTQIGPSEYIINFYENGNYLPEHIKFEKGKLTIQDFSYDNETNVFGEINSQKTIPTQYLELVILSPTIEEYNAIHSRGIYSPPVVFKRDKN